MNLETVLAGIAEKAGTAAMPGDYTENGLLCCGKCRTPKQALIRQPFSQEMKPMPVLCACREKELADKRNETLALERRRMRENALGRRGAEQTFSRADGKQSYAEKVCRGYAEQFSEETTDGLLICGNTGTGKTFLARAVLNAVADKGFSVMFTNVSQLERRLWSSDKAALFERIERVGLFTLDDLGSERQSDYMQQIVFDVLDCRIESGKPFIITSNMTIEELKSPKNQSGARILSRIHGGVSLVAMNGTDRRTQSFIAGSEKRTGEYYNIGEKIMNEELS